MDQQLLSVDRLPMIGLCILITGFIVGLIEGTGNRQLLPLLQPSPPLPR